jgi:acetyl esterase/lipase
MTSAEIIDEYLDVVYHPTLTRDKTRELDLYVPKSAGKQPLIVFIHGGAWRA